MATTYKTFSANDIVATRTLLHEAIPLTGTIVSGTYSDNNIKNYSHGMFQSVFDYPYLSSSANHVFDISLGVHTNSSNYASITVQQAKKKNIYNQMAQVLMGYNVDGTLRQFDEDGNLTGGTKIDDAFFINFSRLLTKDEIKKGTFSLELSVDKTYANNQTFNKRIKLMDTNAQTNYFVNSPAGDYAILYATSSAVAGSTPNLEGETLGAAFDISKTSGQAGFNPAVGLLFYQAGIAVINTKVFLKQSAGILTTAIDNQEMKTGGAGMTAMTTGQEISASADAIRHRLFNIEFNNTTELNSTVYFCRAHHNEFNYSTNPSYLDSSQIRVKNVASDSPVAYITGVGLYSSDNELLASAKVSEPLRKDPTNELTLRVRLDY